MDHPEKRSKDIYKGDLLHMPLIGRFIRSRLYPAIFQYPLMFLFFVILLWAFFGTIQASKNIATLMIWGLWWALLPFSFLLFGRIWCGVCPLAKAGELIQRWFKRSRKDPGHFLRRYGIWITIILFVLLTWFDRISSFSSSPRSTGILLLFLLFGAILTMYFYQRRAWCRYMCPLGGLSGVYSMVSFMELRARKETCKRECREKECINGMESSRCPLFERPLAMESNRNCNFCANCVKICRHHTLSWRLRFPLKEIGQLKERFPAEAFLALVMVVLVYIQTISISKTFPRYMKWFIEESFIKNYHIAFTVNFAGILLLGLVLYGLTSYFSSRYSQESLIHNFRSFGYGLIPLGLAGHLAHNLFHLVKESKDAIQMILLESGILLGTIKESASSNPEMLKGDPLIKAAQIAIVVLGILGSLVILMRSSGSRARNPQFNWGRILPHMIFVAALGVIFLHLFFLPMNPRHFH